MPNSLSLAALLAMLDRPAPPVLIDVRRPAARAASGKSIPQSLRGWPDLAADWGPSLGGRKAVVFCVHGHEVSQGVAEALTRLGVDALYLEGGFAAWEAAGRAVSATGAEP